MKQRRIEDDIEFDPRWTKLTPDNFDEVIFEMKPRGSGFIMVPKKGYIYVLEHNGKWEYRWIWEDVTWERLREYILAGKCYTDVLIPMDERDKEMGAIETPKESKPEKNLLDDF